jgi:hypothetical protein
VVKECVTYCSSEKFHFIWCQLLFICLSDGPNFDSI